MPTIAKFFLRDFKGASNVSLDIGEKNKSPVITLIGLNESGKTTILEGISKFSTSDSLSDIFIGPHAREEISNAIPVSKKAAFSESIRISALILLDDRDVVSALNIADSNGYVLDASRLSRTFTVTSDYKFEDSLFKRRMNFWDCHIFVKSKGKGRKAFARFERNTEGPQPDLWLQIVNAMDERLPEISYFPTFLVSIPPMIYLKAHPGETSANRYYREVLETVAISSGDLSLKRHVCDRIDDFKTKNPGDAWFAKFAGSSTKSLIDAALMKISSSITKEVLGRWGSVFSRPSGVKNIFFQSGVDSKKDDMPYVSFYLSDGESQYTLNERSLGFRWFFVFLLFTAFKKSGKSQIFMFDEPASNLHANAQSELLKSFERTATGGDKIIFSTHSQHMINPRWLSSAYVVDNRAIGYDEKSSPIIDVKPTDIRATGYRHFVGQHPSKSSYFQPVIEALNYTSPEIAGSSPFLLLEGISDYHAIKLYMKQSGYEGKLAPMPGSGAGSSSPLLSLLIGRSDKFFLLLDDDAAGKKEAKRYRDVFFLTDELIATTGELSADFEGFEIEDMLGDNVKADISKELGISKRPTKKQMGIFLSEVNAGARPGWELRKDGMDRLEKLIEIIESKVST